MPLHSQHSKGEAFQPPIITLEAFQTLNKVLLAHFRRSPSA
jgi:hypothetical protein